MTDVFLSYCRRDATFVVQLKQDIEKLGYTTWMDNDHIEGGDQWEAEIEESLEKTKLFIVVVSQDSNASNWVKRETIRAEQLEKTRIPILLNAELPLRLLDLQYVDFRGAYEVGFEGLFPLLEKYLGKKDTHQEVILEVAEPALQEKQSCCTSLIITCGGRRLLLLISFIAVLLAGVAISSIVCRGGLCTVSDEDAVPPTDSMMTSQTPTLPPYAAGEDGGNGILEILQSHDSIPSAQPLPLDEQNASLLSNKKPLFPCSIVGQLHEKATEADCTISPQSTPICLMVFLAGDNQLQYNTRQKYHELTNAPFIKNPNLRLWLYESVDASFPSNTTHFATSRYETFDNDLGEMRIHKGVEGDMTIQLALESFLKHAMDDCQSNNFTSTMAIFSTLGAGFAGFGTGMSRQWLTNERAAATIQNALKQSRSHMKLDVIGFDASLMQAVGAIEEYTNVAHYILASESLVSGQGWSFSSLSSPSNALDLAYQIQKNFLTQNENQTSTNHHPACKSISILDTEKFNDFVAAFDQFFDEALKALETGDASLHAFISRAHSSAVAFEGFMDAVGTQYPTSLDVGSFLMQLRSLCSPVGNTAVGSNLNAAIKAYNEMFVTRSLGPGACLGTGMHILWPNQGLYEQNPALWNLVLFNNDHYATFIAPNFNSFLQWFLTGAPPEFWGASVCINGAVQTAAELIRVSSGSLIIDDSGTVNAVTGNFDVEATITVDVSEVAVKYGIDLSTSLKRLLSDNQIFPNDDEHLHLMLGDVMGMYEGDSFTASWEPSFYFLNIDAHNIFEPIYVLNQGDGSKKIPAMYFMKENRASLAKLQFWDYLFYDFSAWVGNGAHVSFLKFSVDNVTGQVTDNLSLFISRSEGVFAEQPRSAGGYVVPLFFIDAFIQGKQLSMLPGGFNQTVVSWSENLDYNILMIPQSQVFDAIPRADAVVINMYAYNYGNPTLNPDIRRYDVDRIRGAGIIQSCEYYVCRDGFFCSSLGICEELNCVNWSNNTPPGKEGFSEVPCTAEGFEEGTAFCGWDGNCYEYDCSNWYTYGPLAFTGYNANDPKELTCEDYTAGEDENMNSVTFGCRPYAPMKRAPQAKTWTHYFVRKCGANPRNNDEFICYDNPPNTDFRDFQAEVSRLNPPLCDREIYENELPLYWYVIEMWQERKGNTIKHKQGRENRLKSEFFNPHLADRTMFARLISEDEPHGQGIPDSSSEPVGGKRALYISGCFVVLPFFF